jgi:hypothetical protein
VALKSGAPHGMWLRPKRRCVPRVAAMRFESLNSNYLLTKAARAEW